MNYLNFLMFFTGVKVTGSKIDEWAFANNDRPTGKLQQVESVSLSNTQLFLSIVDPDVFLKFKHFPAIIIIVLFFFFFSYLFCFWHCTMFLFSFPLV